MDICPNMDDRNLAKLKPCNCFKKLFFRPMQAVVLLAVLSTYCIVETYRRIEKGTCAINKHIELTTKLPIRKSTKENDDSGIILEYRTFGNFEEDNSWHSKDCYNDICTRVVVQSQSTVNSSASESPTASGNLCSSVIIITRHPSLRGH